MDQVLGLVLLTAYIVGIIGLAAAITWVVIRIFPTERNPKKPDTTESQSNGGSTPVGSLFRRSKRRAT